jgi:hypothetical protein
MNALQAAAVKPPLAFKIEIKKLFELSSKIEEYKGYP